MSVLVEHGGFGATSAAPRAREIMRVALLKDPELRARIEKPLPMPELPPTTTDPDVVDPAMVNPQAGVGTPTT
jgi:penicillin-binding protein 2